MHQSPAESSSSNALLLYFDILGYSALSKSLGIEEIRRILLRADAYMKSVQSAAKWSRAVLSDTYLFWKSTDAPTAQMVVEGIGIGLGFLTLGIATRIPMRGVLVYGSLSPQFDGSSGGTLVGEALVRAHELDRRHNLITLVVASNVVPFLGDAKAEGMTDAHCVVRQADGALICNPLAPMMGGLREGQSIEELRRREELLCTPNLLTLRFLLDERDRFRSMGDFESRVAQKYECTLELIRWCSGESRFEEASRIAREIPSDRIDKFLSYLDAKLRAPKRARPK